MKEEPTGLRGRSGASLVVRDWTVHKSFSVASRAKMLAEINWLTSCPTTTFEEAGSIAPIVVKRVNEFSYEMPYIATARGINCVQLKMLAKWIKFNKTSTRHVNDPHAWTYFCRKMIPLFIEARNILCGYSMLRKVDPYYVSGDVYTKVLPLDLEEFDRVLTLAKPASSYMHGDLTLSNVLIAADDFLVLIDPNPLGFSSYLQDIGKMLQSFRYGYEGYFDTDLGCVNLSAKTIALYEIPLWGKTFMNAFREEFDLGEIHLGVMFEAFHYLRMIPYILEPILKLKAAAMAMASLQLVNRSPIN